MLFENILCVKDTVSFVFMSICCCESYDYTKGIINVIWGTVFWFNTILLET